MAQVTPIDGFLGSALLTLLRVSSLDIALVSLPQYFLSFLISLD